MKSTANLFDDSSEASEEEYCNNYWIMQSPFTMWMRRQKMVALDTTTFIKHNS